MKRLAILGLSVFAWACTDTPTATEQALAGPALSVIGADPLVGAIVLNQGEASEPFTGTCTFAGRVTTDVTLVRNPQGGGLLQCHWAFFPASEFDRARRVDNFNCFLNFFGLTTTEKSQFVLAPNGKANMTCTFESVPTPPTAQCYGQITSGIASTWPWAHDDRVAFPPPPGALRLWLDIFGPVIGISTIRELQLLFCGP